MSSDDDETGRESIGVLLNSLNPENKSRVRYLERLDRKIVNCSYAVKFNKTCINENLLPKYTDIYIYIYLYMYIYIYILIYLVLE